MARLGEQKVQMVLTGGQLLVSVAILVMPLVTFWAAAKGREEEEEEQVGSEHGFLPTFEVRIGNRLMDALVEAGTR